MIILGINAGHGASAALMLNGKLKFVYQEERLTKIKNFNGYPRLSIQKCLNFIRSIKSKIDVAAFCSVKIEGYGFKFPIANYFTIKDFMGFYGEEYYERIFSNKSIKNYFKKLELDKRRKSKYNLNFEKFKNSDLNNSEKFRKYFKDYLINQSKGLINKTYFLDHHTCHAHYAYFSIDRKELKKNKIAVITLDSMGDGSNQTLWFPSKDKTRLININRSSECDLARIYKLVTLILSMKPAEHEYKVMGLAAYAKSSYSMEVFENVFKDLLQIKNCKIVHKNRPKNLYRYLRKKLDQYRFDNIAGGLQIYLEKITSKLLLQINKKYKITHFAISGGVAMNVKMHKVLSELNFLKKIYVAPTGTDESLSIGACYYLQKINSQPLNNIYLGQKLFEKENKIDIQINNQIKKNKNLVIKKNVKSNYIARLLKKGEIVAIAQDREEFGARALGNRSIIADPSNLNVIKVINEMIKNRDFWMPFALTILHNKHKSYIKNNKNILSEFMTIAFNANEKKIDLIKAGTHPYDNTVRPQMLKKNKNENYYNIINEFYKLTNIPAVLNTSLNLHGHPISSDIEDVLFTFNNSGLKYLYLQNKFLIKKLNNK